MLASAITDATAVIASNLVEHIAKGPSHSPKSKRIADPALMAEIYYSFDNAVI
jgi:hypothetical protein